MMGDAYHIAKAAGFPLAIAIVALYRRNVLLAVCGVVAASSIAISLNSGQGIPVVVQRAAHFCAFSFGFLTFVFWIRLIILQQRSKAQ